MSSFLDNLFTGGVATALATPIGAIDVDDTTPAVDDVLKVLSTSPLRAGWSPPSADPVTLGLARTSLQPHHLAMLPLEQFTPGLTLGLAPLTDANLQASIDNARTYAMSIGGATIMVPHGSHSGKWHPPAVTIPSTSLLEGDKAALILRGGGYGVPLNYVGAPGNGIIVAPECNVGLYIHSPLYSPGVADVLTNSLISEWWVTPEQDGQVCDAVRFHALVQCVLRNIYPGGFDGTAEGLYGAGLVCGDDWVGGGGNSQACQFQNIWSETNQINFRMSEITTCWGVGMNSQGSLHRAWLCEHGAEVIVCSSGIQEVLADVFVELAGSGIMSFINCYHEGGDGSQTFFKSSDITNSSTLLVQGLRLGNPVAIFADIANNTRLVVRDCFTLANALKYLKCVETSEPIVEPIEFSNNSINPADVLDPSKFELSAVAMAKLTVREGGRMWNGGKMWHGMPVQLAAFAEGSEPASPVESELLWNATTHRPRVRGASAHHDVALADDPVTLVDLLKAKASDVWDLNVAAKRSVTGGGLNSVTGLLHATSLAENSGGATRPPFTAANAAFNNRATVTFVAGSSTFLRSTLADPILAGEYAALFIVCALGDPTVSGVNRIIANLPGTGGLFLGANDGNVGIQTYYGNQFAQNTHGAADSFPHAIYVDPWVENNFHGRVLVDGVTGTAGSGIAPAPSGSLSSFDVGGQASGLVASDMTVGIVALLHSPLSPPELARAFALAAQLYAIG
jgi:hypothetical protein